MTGLPSHRYPSPPSGLTKALLRLPVWAYRARFGWLLGQRFVCIDHIGRRTGTHHRTVVEVVACEPDDSYVVASGWGPQSNWYRNLLAHPRTTIHIGHRNLSVLARRLSAEEGAAMMLNYARRHPHAARRLSRFMGFAVDDSDAGYRAVGQTVPFLQLQPSPASAEGTSHV